jgi:hypothetical protein
MDHGEIMEDIRMTNGMDPNTMAAEERLAEVSMLLSLAMMRMWLKRRGGACHLASRERAISRVFDRDSLGFDAESLPHVTAG